MSDTHHGDPASTSGGGSLATLFGTGLLVALLAGVGAFAWISGPDTLRDDVSVHTFRR